jgi:acyl dehydratase
MQHYTMAQLPGMVGKDLATSDWLTVDQDRIQRFAEATDDHQWIHVDPERAGSGPFGACVAHGYLTLSLLAQFMQQTVTVDGATMGVNYGLNKVRFPAPVPVGSRLRAHIKLLAAEPVQPDGMQMTWGVTVEREGSDKPVCVAESLSRSYGAPMGA